MAAAKAEFSALGFAGARLNRIAAEANASKERLYSYFQSKQNLFEAVTRIVADAIETREDDESIVLRDWAVRSQGTEPVSA